jgi:hypothetical protein
MTMVDFWQFFLQYHRSGFGYFVGIKKDFQLTKHLNGNVQMLYNLYNLEKRVRMSTALM